MSERVSLRAEAIVASPPVPEYMGEHFERLGDGWHLETRPDGYVSMCIAENKLMWDLLVPKLAQHRDVPPRVLGYDRMIGSLDFREKLSTFMGRTFLGRDVDPEHIAVLSGAGSVIELLFYALADPGDGILVPTPSYAGFWADLETRDELKIVPVHCSSDDGFRLTVALLDEALATAGRPVKALLFTTPNNPLGWVYTKDEIAEIVEWSRRHEIHVVFDEIYALSVFGASSFVSVAAIEAGLGPLVHIIWAFSKDFGASGLRCGLLVSENEAVRTAVEGLAYWACCSGDTQYLLGELISDEVWIDDFIDQMQRRLGGAYHRVTASLDEHEIPHIEAEAGIFLVCDLRQFLDEPSWDAEDRLWRRLLDEGNVNLTPGSACHINEPGFFRICYASERTEAVVAGIERMGRVLAPA